MGGLSPGIGQVCQQQQPLNSNRIPQCESTWICASNLANADPRRTTWCLSLDNVIIAPLPRGGIAPPLQDAVVAIGTAALAEEERKQLHC